MFGYLGWFLAENQSNHQNFDPYLLPKKFWLIFIGMKQKTKTKIEIEKNNLKWPTQKTDFFRLVNSQYFITKISEISPWVRRINWCNKHWFYSIYIYMVVNVRLSDVKSKKDDKKLKCVIISKFNLCWTA